MKNQIRLMASIATLFCMLVSSRVAIASENLWEKISTSGTLVCGAIAGDPIGSWKAPGKDDWQGYEINLCRAIAHDFGKHLGKPIKVEFKETTWATVVLDLQSGKLDLWPGMTASAERKRAIDMAGPMYALPNCIVDRKGLSPRTRWDEYNDPTLRLAAVTGTLTEKGLREDLAPKATHLSFKDLTEATLAVQSGRADAIGLDILRCLSTMKAKGLFGNLVFPEPIRANPSSAGMRKDGDGRFHAWAQKWAEESGKNGKIKQILIQAMKQGGYDISLLPESIRF